MTTHDAVLTLVKGGRMAKLTGDPLAVLLVYIAHADGTGRAWPSLKTICELAGIAAAANVCRARKTLIDAGLMNLDRRTQRSTVYLLTLDAVSKAHSVENAQCEKRTMSKAHSVISTPQTVSKAHKGQCKKRTEKQTKEADQGSSGKTVDSKVKSFPEVPDALNTKTFRDAVDAWAAHRGAAWTATAAARAFGLLTRKSIGPADAAEMIHTAIDAGWKGFVFPDSRPSLAAASGIESDDALLAIPSMSDAEEARILAQAREVAARNKVAQGAA